MSPATDAVWPAVVNTALLGTERAALTVPPTGDSLGTAAEVLARDAPDRAAALLRVAAAASAYRRCGWTPRRTEEPPAAVCPPDARPLCSPAAIGLLRRIMRGEHEQLLGAWLTLADRHGMRAPADVLGDLLDTGRTEPRLRPLILAVGGTRAPWLARFNEDWAYAIASGSIDTLVTMFETATGPARLAALQQIRLLDTDRARAELEKTWIQESPPDRAAFVGALRQGLSAADEPFLEHALDDRRKEVRQQAAALLARLATSALVARLTSRARELVTLGKSSILKRARIEVTPPAATDAALIRDGVEPKPAAGTGIGERAWWLAQIIGAVPPSSWTSAWALEPSAIVKAAEGHEWHEPLVAGWLTATERHRDVAWAEALWRNEQVARVSPSWGAPPPERVFTAVVGAERVDAELRHLVDTNRDALRGSHAVLAALLEWPHEWSEPLARTVARRLKEYAGDNRVLLTAEFGVRALLERCAQAVPPSAIPAFLDGWPEHADAWGTWARAIDSLTSVLRFRDDLHLAFNEESPP